MWGALHLYQWPRHSEQVIEQIELHRCKLITLTDRGHLQEAITRSVHLHCIRDQTYAQIELFLDMFPANFCLHCGSYMTELNVEKNGHQSEVPHPSSVFLNHFCPFPRWFQPYADRSGDRRSRETILKIAQSGHRLSLRLSMGERCTLRVMGSCSLSFLSFHSIHFSLLRIGGRGVGGL